MMEFVALPREERLRRLAVVARAALNHYDVPAGASVELINLSENATYRVDASDGRTWALRVHRDGYHSRAAIASELSWLTALRRDCAILTPIPMAGKDGGLIQVVDLDLIPRPRHVVMTRWETGKEPDQESTDLRTPFERLGEISARMHSHAQTWKRPDFFQRFTWVHETSLGSSPHWGRWQDGLGITPEIRRIFGHTVDVIGMRLDAFGKGKDRFGLLHCDLRLANLLVDGNTTKVIDFDDCGFSWFLYDCATSVSFFEHKPEVPELLDAWVKGYRRVRDLPMADEDEIWTFVMLRRLLLVAWIGSHSETELAESMGVEFTHTTVPLCEDYLSRFA